MREGEIDHIRRCYENSRGELFAYALSLTRDRHLAEEAVHGAFAGLLKRRRLPEELRPYIFRCVRNAALDLAAARQRNSGNGLLQARAGVDPALPALMHDLLEQLGADQREAVVLKIYGRLTLREIAEMRAVSINTAASWYRRGLERLRTLMEEVPNGPD